MKNLIDKIESFSSTEWDAFLGNPEKAISASALPSATATVISWACEEAGSPILVFGGNIYIYNGKYYSRGELRSLMYETLKKLSHPWALINDSEFVKKVEKNLQLASSTHRNGVEMNPRGINFEDGTLLISRMKTEFVEHSHQRVFTYCLPFKYNGIRVKSDVWTPFIEQIIPEKQYREYTLASLANSIAGDPMYAQRMLLLMGVGASGKSTLIEAVTAAIGKNNVCNIDDLKNLTKDDSRYRIDLANNILCVCGDASGNIGNKDVLKQIVSKEELSGRRLYKEVEYFTPRASLIVASNEIGFTHVLSDSGISRRLDIIEFRNPIEESKRDPHIGRKLEAPNEMREMILDMVGCLVDMQNQHDGKMVRPERLVNTLEKLKKEGDSFLSFIESAGLETVSEEGVNTIWIKQKPLADMFNHYRQENRNGTISTSKVKQKARDHGAVEKGAGGNGDKYLFKIVDSKLYDALHTTTIYDSSKS